MSEARIRTAGIYYKSPNVKKAGRKKLLKNNVIKGQVSLDDLLSGKDRGAEREEESIRFTGDKWCAGEFIDMLRLLPPDKRLMVPDLMGSDNDPKDCAIAYIHWNGATVSEVIRMLKVFDPEKSVRIRDYSKVSETGIEIFRTWHKAPMFERYFPNDPDVRRVRFTKGRPPEGENLIICFIDRRYGEAEGI